MDLRVSAIKFEIDNKFKNYIEKKLERIVHYFKKLIDVHIILKKERQNYIAEIILTGDGKKFCFNAKSNDIRTSIDLLIDKAESQISKFERKRHEHRIKRTALKYREGPIPQLVVTNIKDYYVKPMSILEAILQLDLMKTNFLIFPEANTLSLYIVYKDNSGLNGIIREVPPPFSLIRKILGKKEKDVYIKKELVYIKDNDVKILESKRIALNKTERNNAIINLTNSKQPFYLFIDKETSIMNVVYKRDKNNFGLIEMI